MSRVLAYRLVRLFRALVVANTFTLIQMSPLSASPELWELFAPVDPCAAPTATVDETIDALRTRGWEAVPDRTALDPDVRSALTWTRTIRWGGLPASQRDLDALARNGIEGGIPGLFAHNVRAVSDEAAKEDTGASANRVLVRHRDGELDVLSLSYRSPLGSMRQVLCLAGFGPSAAEVIVDWVEAKEGPLASHERPLFSYGGSLSPHGHITGGSTKYFALNPGRLPDVPAEWERRIDGVVEFEVHYRVQEN